MNKYIKSFGLYAVLFIAVLSILAAVNSNYTDINVKNQEADAHSVLNYYRKLIALRKSDEYKSLFTYGEFVPVYDYGRA